jgi:hypothetical protein
VELPEEYFEDKEKIEKLLAMSTDQVKFWIDELALFSESTKNASASRKDKKIGSSVNLNVKHDKEEEATTADLVGYLKSAMGPKAKEASAAD